MNGTHEVAMIDDLTTARPEPEGGAMNVAVVQATVATVTKVAAHTAVMTSVA